jgi:hypothetical protein
MRAETNRRKLEAFMSALGNRVRSPGGVYLTGGATAILHGWREMTIDVDIKPDPEPNGLFEALSALKNELDINVELACPDQFIPALPNWRERSLFIAKHGQISFYHYDPYGQVLSKLQRRHERDLTDIQAFLNTGLVEKDKLWNLFTQIEPHLIRYPAIDSASFRNVVNEFCHDY